MCDCQGNITPTDTRLQPWQVRQGKFLKVNEHFHCHRCSLFSKAFSDSLTLVWIGQGDKTSKWAVSRTQHEWPWTTLFSVSPASITTYTQSYRRQDWEDFVQGCTVRGRGPGSTIQNVSFQTWPLSNHLSLLPLGRAMFSLQAWKYVHLAEWLRIHFWVPEQIPTTFL